MMHEVGLCYSSVVEIFRLLTLLLGAESFIITYMLHTFLTLLCNTELYFSIFSEYFYEPFISRRKTPRSPASS